MDFHSLAAAHVRRNQPPKLNARAEARYYHDNAGVRLPRPGPMLTAAATTGLFVLLVILLPV